MGPKLRFRTEVVVVFVASLLAGCWAARRTDGRERLRRNVVTNVLSTVGLLVGYRLARRRQGPDR